MPDPRNNIQCHYPRATRIELVRWREVEGLSLRSLANRTAERWPDLPRIHATTWKAWQESPEYQVLRGLVLGEQAERERLSDLFRAAGGTDALEDISDAAAYALAAKAMQMASDTDDAREIGSLMRTVREAKSLATQEIRERYEAKLRALGTEYAAAIAQRDAEIQRLRTQLAANPAPSGLRPETLDEIERRIGLL